MDIDIDFPSTFDPSKYFDTVHASMVQNNALVSHPCGEYFQRIAKDKITGLAAIPYKEAEKLGYFKIDFLRLSVLNVFENKDQIRTLLKREPDWTLLENPDVVSKLFQIHKHFDVISQLKPKSVQELADCVAIIRPGKKKLLAAYIKDKHVICKELYRKEHKSDFRRSHAIAYALTIVLQLHLVKGGIL